MGEIYHNGKLIGTTENEPLDLPPDWTEFNLALLNNTAYNRVAKNTTEQQAKNRLEAYAIALGTSTQEANYSVFAMLWNQMMGGILVNLVSASEIAGWKAIAQSSRMPFTFNNSGRIIL